jgi:hypothetical protein
MQNGCIYLAAMLAAGARGEPGNGIPLLNTYVNTPRVGPCL